MNKESGLIRIENKNNEKEKYLELLLIADPSVEMIMKYLPNSDLYVMFENDLPVCATAVLVEETTAEVKNICTAPEHQQKGYGKRMMQHIIQQYADSYEIILGTGGTGIPGKEFFQVKFYRDCGFKEYKIIKNFFVDNYPEPIIEEDGNQCVDMVYMKYVR